MNPNWIGTLCSAGALALFFLTHRFSANLPQRKKILLALITSIIALPGASFAFYYTHLLPETAWYYEFRSWRGTELLLLPLGLAGGFLASLLPRKLLILPLFGVAAFAIVPILKPFIRPIPAGTLNDKWDGAVCLQSTPSTCGAASVATILRLHGVTVTERQLAEEAHSYAGGTEAWYLSRAIRAHSCQSQFKFSSGFDAEISLPAVAGVRLDNFGHFIALLSRDGDRFLIGDPLNGPEMLSREELQKRYQFTGFYMLISKDP